MQSWKWTFIPPTDRAQSRDLAGRQRPTPNSCRNYYSDTSPALTSELFTITDCYIGFRFTSEVNHIHWLVEGKEKKKGTPSSPSQNYCWKTSSRGLLFSVASISVGGTTDLIHIRIWKYISLAFWGEEKKTLSFCTWSLQQQTRRGYELFLKAFSGTKRAFP